MEFISIHGVLKRKDFKELGKVLRELFHMPIPKERKPVNALARKYVLRDMELKAKESASVDIYSIMESLVWHRDCSYDYDSILNLSPNQIYNGYARICKKDTHGYYMQGIYFGKIDQSKTNLNKISWVGKIQ